MICNCTCAKHVDILTLKYLLLRCLADHRAAAAAKSPGCCYLWPTMVYSMPRLPLSVQARLHDADRGLKQYRCSASSTGRVSASARPFNVLPICISYAEVTSRSICEAQPCSPRSRKCPEHAGLVSVQKKACRASASTPVYSTSNPYRSYADRDSSAETACA